MDYFIRACFLILLLLGFCLAFSITAQLVSFSQEFEVTSPKDRVRRTADNNSVRLTLDRYGGAGFSSKHEYIFGLLSSKGGDEMDFELLGNRSGQPYTVQTNVFSKGKGEREQRVHLWFDPSHDFHTYSILWNHHHIVFSVDKVPIRVFKNNWVKLGVPYPSNQSMRIYSTLWNGDGWATRGGLEKIDWSKAPFHAYYKDFTIDSCRVPVNASCSSNRSNWLYRWVRVNYMIYDYCTDRSRFLVPPPECTAGL